MCFFHSNDPDVNAAVREAVDDNHLLMGAGPTEREGELAELICRYLPSVDKIQITNTGSEATFHAIRLARAHTGRDDVIIMQGGFNGWHDAVAANVISNLNVVGPRVSPGEYPFDAISAGIPEAQKRQVHVVNFNALACVRHVAERHQIACLILEPILQNIGIVRPVFGYLEGLRKLADEFGFLLYRREPRFRLRCTAATNVDRRRHLSIPPPHQTGKHFLRPHRRRYRDHARSFPGSYGPIRRK